MGEQLGDVFPLLTDLEAHFAGMSAIDEPDDTQDREVLLAVLRAQRAADLEHVASWLRDESQHWGLDEATALLATADRLRALANPAPDATVQRQPTLAVDAAEVRDA